MTAISSPGGDGVSAHSRGIRAPPSLSLDEQQSIERQVRTAALAAARNNIAQGDLDRIVSLATDDFSLGAPARSMADRINLAVSLAEAVEKTHAPFNWLSATPQQIEAYRAAMGLLGHHHFAGFTNFTSNGGGGGAGGSGGGTRMASGETPATSTAYDQALNSSERSVFNSLSKQYGPAAANGALAFARDLGTTPDMARKLIRLDQNERHDLKGFINEARNLPPEEQRKRAEEWSKKHKGKLSPNDLLKLIRDDAKKNVKPGNEGSVHDKSQNERTADNQRIGIQNRVESDHRTKVADLNHNPSAIGDTANRFAMRSAQRHEDNLDQKPDAAGTKSGANAPPPGPEKKDASTKTPADEKAPNRRQALNQKGLNPKA